MTFSAGNARLNATIDAGHSLISRCNAIGITGGVLYCNPVPGGAEAVSLIAEPDFAANGVPTDGTPIFLQVAFPGNGTYPFNYTVGLVMADIGTDAANDATAIPAALQ